MKLIAQFGLFNGILVLIFIFAYSYYRTINKVFLGLSLFFAWYTLLILHLNTTGLILQYPFLQRTGLITAYLTFPFLFIYSRNTFYPGKLWHKTDWLLLLPAIIYIIDLMPFFLMPLEERNEIWRENLGDYKKMILAKEGWIGLEGFHFAFIYVWIAIILYFQVRLINRNQHIKIGFKSIHNRRLLSFIIMITLLYLPLFIPGIFGVLFQLPWFNSEFIEMTYGISLTAISIYMLIYPNVLYGFLPEKKFTYSASTVATPEYKETKTIMDSGKKESGAFIDETGKAETDSQTLADGEIPVELKIVLAHMIKEKPYIKQGFSIQDLSTQTGVPVYQLSPLINRHFKMNFTSWINRYRVEYFIEQATKNRNMTLEAHAKDSGFTSRTTFISAFKKEKGVTPGEYIKAAGLNA